MRALLALVLLGGCFGSGSGGGAVRPGVMPLLSELPGDASKRDAVLDQAAATAGPEHRKGMTSKERKAETAAATAAAILGNIFSKTKSVTIGTASQFDENRIIAPEAVPTVLPTDKTGEAARADGEARPDAPPPTAPNAPSNNDLIPWIRLK
ncbi:MAG TPA: hypothetical protein VGD80_07680 [Kofleriaceae bacterium]